MPFLNLSASRRGEKNTSIRVGVLISRDGTNELYISIGAAVAADLALAANSRADLLLGSGGDSGLLVIMAGNSFALHRQASKTTNTYRLRSRSAAKGLPTFGIDQFAYDIREVAGQPAAVVDLRPVLQSTKC